MDEVRLGSRTLQPGRQLLADGERVPIGKRALDIVSVLAEAGGEIVTKDELLEAVWPGVTVEENALQVHIVALRKALGPEADRLRTIRGVGYQLEIDAGTAKPPLPAISHAEAATTPYPESEGQTASSEPPVAASPSAPVLTGPQLGAKTARHWAGSHRLALASAFMLALFAGAWVLFGADFGLRSQERIPVVVRALTASGNGGQTEQALAGGITDELISRLRRIPELRVATATPDGTVPSDAFSDAYVIDGSIRTSGSQLRVAVRLADANGEVLWSDTLDRGVSDLFALQEDIASSIAGALSVSFEVGANAPQYGGTDNPEAHAAYLQYRANLTNSDPDVPLRYLQRALTLDPNYGKALSSLAISYAIRAQNTPSSNEAQALLAEMDRRTAQAVASNPDLWIAHLARGWHLMARRELSAADREMRRVAELDNGNDPELPARLATYSYMMGRARKGFSFQESAEMIDPVQRTDARRTWGLLLLGRYRDAIDLFDELVASDPRGLAPSAPYVFWSHLLLRQEADAVRVAEEHSPQLAEALREFKADEELLTMSRAELRAWATERYDGGGHPELSLKALFAGHYGHTRLAIDLLHVAYERVGVAGFTAIWHPALAQARKSDEFEQLVTEIGLVKMWRESGDWGDYCRPLSAGKITCS